MDAPDVANMTAAEKRKLLVAYWTKNPPVAPTPAGASSAAPAKLKASPPTGGPGTEQKQLLTELGFDADAINAVCKTGCLDYAAQMDHWGIEGCKARLHEIAGRLKDQAIAQKARFRDSPGQWAGVATRALKLGLVLNPLHPYPGLVLECIRRAEAKAAGPTKPAAGIPPSEPEASGTVHESEGGPT